MNVENLPKAVYLDTSLVVAAMFEDVVHAQESIAFCQRLVSKGTNVVFSTILRVELTQALGKLPLRDQLSADTSQTHRLDIWNRHERVRREWMSAGIDRFARLPGQFPRAIEVQLTLPIWYDSIDVMTRHRLRSLDAVHVATARAAGLRDLATLDDHFRRVTLLTVWQMRSR